jgi:hypothetical protein
VGDYDYDDEVTIIVAVLAREHRGPRDGDDRDRHPAARRSEHRFVATWQLEDRSHRRVEGEEIGSFPPEDARILWRHATRTDFSAGTAHPQETDTSQRLHAPIVAGE